MTRIILAVALLCAFSVNAEARQRHKPTGLHPLCNITMPCTAPYASTPAQSRWDRGTYIERQTGIGGPRVKQRPRAAVEARERVAAVSPTIIGGIGMPIRYIAGRLVCALNINSALAERGIRGTGSALALSFDTWGLPSVPIPGAVAVSNRRGRGKGHVALVSRVEGSRVWVWNATGGRRGWREIEYTNWRARYRVAG